MRQEPIIAMEHAGTAIQLCALANLQSAIALPLLAARRASPADAERLYTAVLEYIDGAVTSYEAHRIDPSSVDTAGKALAHDTVSYSTSVLKATRDGLVAQRKLFGTTRALRTFQRRIAHRVDTLLRELPADSPLRETTWTPSLDTTAPMPSVQLVHYLALTPVGLVLRETLHQAGTPTASA